jgi:hypothetical protein
MMESQALETSRRRAAQNQSRFREVNERIEELVATSSYVSFVCECANERCVDSLSLTIEEYEHVRRDANRFVVLPGHDVPEVENVVDATDRYLVVAKVGAGMAVARRLNPRRPTTH